VATLRSCWMWYLLVALTAVPLSSPLSAQEPSALEQRPPLPPGTIPDGTRFLIRLEERLDASRVQPGKRFKAKLLEDLVGPDETRILRNSRVKGHISAVGNGFHPRLLLSFDEIETERGWVPLIATLTDVPGERGLKVPDEEGQIEREGNRRREAESAGVGAGVGAVGGAAAGGGKGADGKFEANPDTALMQFNISAQEATSREAYDRASKEAEQVRQILRSNGIDPKSAEIGYFSLQPVYDYKTAKRKLVGYRVNANVSLKLKDFSKIAPIVQQLADTDVSENQSLNYTLEDMDAAKAKAVEDAYKRARESASALARSAGRTLGELSYASVDTFENVRPMPMAGAMMKMNVGAAPAPTEEFTPQSVSVTAHVNALFSLK
jgi:uncharacterized protein